MKSIFAIHPAIIENMENMPVKRTPQGLIIGTPVSQYALYSVMFCLLHSNIYKQRTAQKASLQSIQPLRKVRRIRS